MNKEELSKLTNEEKVWIRDWNAQVIGKDYIELWHYIEDRIDNRLARLEMTTLPVYDSESERITAESYKYLYDPDEFLSHTLAEEFDQKCRPSCNLDCPECGSRLNIYTGECVWYKCPNPRCEWNIWTMVEFWRKKRELFNIGCGGKQPEQLLQILAKNNISVVIDVRREHARSYLGKYYASSIGNLFWDNGIGYEHWSFFGNYYETLEEYQLWLDLLAGDDLVKLNNLTQRIRDERGNVCLLCAEKEAEECHRLILAKGLVTKLGANWEVRNL